MFLQHPKSEPWAGPDSRHNGGTGASAGEWCHTVETLDQSWDTCPTVGWRPRSLSLLEMPVGPSLNNLRN